MQKISANIRKAVALRLIKPVRMELFRKIAESIMAGSRYSVRSDFIRALKDEGVVKMHAFKAQNGKIMTCVSASDGADLDIHEVALALFPNGYFCNMTAVYHHGLTNQIPSRVHICHETITEKPDRPHPVLSASAVRNAFIKPHRPTTFILPVHRRELVVVDRYRGSDHGVETILKGETVLPSGSRIAGLERTLIDAVVAPHYNGGIVSIPEYFSSARNKLKIDKLVQIYAKLRFVYPYAQAIGFVLERSGMQEAAERFFREFPPSVQFFADHNAKSTWTYNERWMLYHPPGL